MKPLAPHRAREAVLELRALYGPSKADYLQKLKEAASSAVFAVEELERNTTKERAQRLADHFGGMQREATRFATTLSHHKD